MILLPTTPVTLSMLHRDGGGGASAFPKLNRGIAGMDAARVGCTQMSLHRLLHMEQHYWNYVVGTLPSPKSCSQF